MLINLETLETKPKSPHLYLNSQLRTHKDYILCTTVAGLVISLISLLIGFGNMEYCSRASTFSSVDALALSYFSSTLAFTLPIFSLVVAAAFLTACILSPVQNPWHKSSLLRKQTQNSRPCKILELRKYKRNKQKNPFKSCKLKQCVMKLTTVRTTVSK